MSIENTKLGNLLEKIKEAGSTADNDYILYRLFTGEDISDCMDGVSFLENVEWREAEKKVVSFLDMYGYKQLDSDGGYEGGGEYCFGVIEVGGEFFKAEWSYYSYNGCEYDGIEHTIRQVQAIEKLVTVYE